MSRAEGFRVLCDCLSEIASGHEPREPFREDSDNFSWATFISLAHEYRVSSTLACAMRACRRKSIPRGAEAYFDGLANHCRQRNEEIRGEAIKIAIILNEIDVIPMFMKGGAHLLARLYPDIGMREMADLDILIPPTRINDCVAKLADYGITFVGDNPHPRSHHCHLGGNDLPVSIELHHSVLAYPHGEFLRSEELIASAIELDNYGVRIAVPSAACATIHNIAHAQLNDHDYIYGRIDLRGLLDLALLSHAHGDKLDWSEISTRFVHSGWRHAWEYNAQWARRIGAAIPSLNSISAMSRLFYVRSAYHVRAPKMLGLNVRLLRVWLLLRRELSDLDLRRRLAGNFVKVDWWKRHLGMLFR